MTKTDSALKGSARVGQLAAFGFLRKVAKPNGIITSASGTFLPTGCSAGIPTHMIHRNPDTYPNPNSYQPFRFAELRAQATATNDDEKDLTTVNTTATLKPSFLTFTTTSPHFQTFSHGRHACPGRFFAANELKLLMAYIVQQYDFEMLETRPEQAWFGNTIVCPLDQTIRVRRREKT